MTTGTTDKVMIALETASERVGHKDSWATIPQIKAYAVEANLKPSNINQSSLEALVAVSRAERRYPLSNMNRMYRPALYRI